MIEPPGKPGIALYLLSTTTKKDDTYASTSFFPRSYGDAPAPAPVTGFETVPGLAVVHVRHLHVVGRDGPGHRSSRRPGLQEGPGHLAEDLWPGEVGAASKEVEATCLAVPSPLSSGIILFKERAKPWKMGGSQRERWVKRMGNQTFEHSKSRWLGRRPQMRHITGSKRSPDWLKHAWTEV